MHLSKSIALFTSHLLSEKCTVKVQLSEAFGRRRGSGGLPPAAPGGSREAAGENGSSPPAGRRWKLADILERFGGLWPTWGCLRGRSPFNEDEVCGHPDEKKQACCLLFLVWMTGLEPATSWSLTRCATNCATSRGPFFKGTANIGILFRKCKRAATYFSAGGVERASCRAFRADFRAEEAFMRRMGPLTQAKVFRSSFSSSGVKLG